MGTRVAYSRTSLLPTKTLVLALYRSKKRYR